MAAKSKFSISASQVAFAYQTSTAHAAAMIHRWGEAVVADADILFDAMAGTARASKTRTRLSDPEARQRVNLRFAAAMEIDRLQSQIRELKKL